MSKRRCEEEVSDTAPQKSRITREEYIDRLRPQGRARRRHVPLPVVQNQLGYFRGMELRALPTDTDLRSARYISIADRRQQARIRKRHKCQNCRTCLRAGHEIAVLNYPCGHMANCSDCAPHMHTCACCYKPIQLAFHCPVNEGNYDFIGWFHTANAIIPRR